jgi:hypothetical protein
MQVQEFKIEVTHYKVNCPKCKKEFKSSSKFTVLKWMTQHLSVSHGIAIPMTDKGAAITHAANAEALMEAHLKEVK